MIHKNLSDIPQYFLNNDVPYFLEILSHFNNPEIVEQITKLYYK